MAGLESHAITSTLQDPATMVALHPGAVAGFCGLMIHSLALLPLGCTDGGRISLALFARSGQIFVGAGVWLSLLVASLTMERPDILLAVWLLNNWIERDVEIPCRDETEGADISRFVAAFTVWLVALLAIVPMQ